MKKKNTRTHTQTTDNKRLSLCENGLRSERPNWWGCDVCRDHSFAPPMCDARSRTNEFRACEVRGRRASEVADSAARVLY
jgi:hypothetical protein